MSSHLGTDLAALVDGELDHASRERVLGHLTRCQDCRAEVESERLLKARLREVAGPAPSGDLAARLRAVAARPDGGVAGGAWAAGGAGAAGVVARGSRRTSAPRTPRSPRGPGGGRRLPRTAVGGVVLAFGLGAVLVLGGSHREPLRAPVDPGSDALLIDYTSTSGELPLPEPAGVSSAGLGR